jgi:cell division protein FtsN
MKYLQLKSSICLMTAVGLCTQVKTLSVEPGKTPFRVQIGGYTAEKAALESKEKCLSNPGIKEITALGLPVTIQIALVDDLYKVYLGAYATVKEARKVQEILGNHELACYVVTLKNPIQVLPEVAPVKSASKAGTAAGVNTANTEVKSCWRYQVGSFAAEKSAESQIEKVKKTVAFKKMSEQGIDVKMIEQEDCFKVFIGDFLSRQDTEKAKVLYLGEGIDGWIVETK